jgi:hypothetical protein
VRSSLCLRPCHAPYGTPCWNVKPGFGSFVTLEFGRPHLVVNEPRSATALAGASRRVRRRLTRRRVCVRGRWRPWIYCCDWEARVGGAIRGDSSSARRRASGGEALDGLRLLVECAIRMIGWGI